MPCSPLWEPLAHEDIAKEMATLAKANRGTGKDLAKNLSLATASLEFKFGVTNGLTIRNSSGEIEDGNYSSNEIARPFEQWLRHALPQGLYPTV